jgi:RNA polymerase sigma-70 factor (ECF subfamily)
VADVTVLDVRRLQAEADAADVVLAMDEDAFRAFYDRTAGALWGYLSRISGDRQVADDLLQESYYRLLKCTVAFESEAHRRNYLYRIATNLVRDARRAPQPLFDAGVEVADMPAPEGPAGVERRTDVRRAFGRLKPRERALLWLAYAHGSSHGEIADVLGVKTASIKQLLFRARRKLAATLQR